MNNSNINGSNFLVSIHHQENHSWQGVVQWLDTGEKIHFRSELELMNLIYDAVMKGQEQQKSLRTWDDRQDTRAI